jgi:hypothetical protein
MVTLADTQRRVEHGKIGLSTIYEELRELNAQEDAKALEAFHSSPPPFLTVSAKRNTK